LTFPLESSSARLHRALARLASLALWALAVVAFPRAAFAQYSVPSQAASSSERVGTARSKVREELVSPDGWEVGASLNFITSEPSLGGEDLKFTDMVLLRLHGLVSVGGSVELFGGTDVLPKQPSYTDELVWQGALGGARFKVGDSFAAWIRATGGPQLDQSGWWLGGNAALQYKLALEKVLFFEAALGWGHSQLLFDEDTDGAFFLDEIFTQVGIALRDPKNGHFGAWLMFDYFVPVLSSPDTADPVSGGFLDPQPRVNFHLGGLIGVSESVDLFIEWSILDRGEIESGPTTLPILNGGFDQKQLLFGFMRRFGRETRN